MASDRGGVARGDDDRGLERARGERTRRVVGGPAPKETGPGIHHKSAARRLVLLFTHLLAITFASERLFHALLLAWLQIEGVTLDLFDDVFRLHLALEAAQGILKRFTFLNSYLCQGK